MTEHSVLNKVCPQGKLSYWSLTNWGYQHLTGIKNGSIQLHVLVAFLSLWGRNYIQKNTRLWRPQPSDTGSLKYPIWGLQNVPLPPPTHTHTHLTTISVGLYIVTEGYNWKIYMYHVLFKNESPGKPKTKGKEKTRTLRQILT